MAGKVRFTDEVMDNILLLRQSGVSVSDIITVLGLTPNPTYTVLRIYDNLKNGNPLNGCDMRPNIVKWACKKLGLDYDTIMMPAAVNPPAKEAPQETRDAADEANTALAVAAILEAIKSLTASVSALESRLSTMQMTLAGTRDDANQNTKRIVEAINVNGDIQTKEWQDVKDRLEAIKINTMSLRKGGNF